MAIVTLRFRFVGPMELDVEDQIVGSATRTDLVVSGSPLSDWTFDDANTDPADIVSALEEAGWEQVTDTTPPVTPAVFVMRPGGTAGGNIYTDWATLFAAYEQTDGPVTIEFDDSISSPITIPDGTYAFRPDTTLEGILRSNATLGTNVGSAVDLADGVVFDPPPLYFRNGITLRSLSSSPIITVDPTGGAAEFAVLLLERGSTFTCLGTAPFIQVNRLTSNGGLFVFLINGGRFEGGTAAVVQLIGDELAPEPAVLSMTLLSSATIETDTIEGNLQGFFFANIDASSDFSETQSGYTAALPVSEAVTIRSRRWLPTTTIDALTAASLNIVPNMTVRCDPLTNGPMAVLLPSVSSFRPGDELLIKNVTASPNTITVTPSGGDTVDGAPSLLLSTPRGSVKLQSDGGNDWMVV